MKHGKRRERNDFSFSYAFECIAKCYKINERCCAGNGCGCKNILKVLLGN